MAYSTSIPDAKGRSNIPLPYRQKNSRMDFETQILSALGLWWKNEWKIKGHNTTHNMDSSGGSKIVFPEESGVFPEESASKYTPQVDGQKPKCVNEYDFCESVNGYPRDYLKKVLENDVGASIYQQFFGSDLLDVGPRFGEEETSLCPSVEEIVFPKVAQNKDAKWRYVINEEDYVQGIRIEKCG
ncbi:hypothetical protein ANN_05072 [Periplaneta americana]|uniref:Spaetzle domain-containing protein n=1 Tax=Periplaneta americana TaxID=6978 RepID=A0ABQ8TBT1_PERAM|nr:hypothetical protein ANN_05072 [Periplaneta americana]